MRLFRQERPGDWDSVIRCMITEIRVRIENGVIGKYLEKEHKPFILNRNLTGPADIINPEIRKGLSPSAGMS